MSSKIPTIDISALYSNDLKAKQEVPAQINSGYLWLWFFSNYESWL